MGEEQMMRVLYIVEGYVWSMRMWVSATRLRIQRGRRHTSKRSGWVFDVETVNAF